MADTSVAAAARVYLRPAGLDPTPGPGRLPLAGGAVFFSLLDLAVRDPAGCIVARWHGPVAAFEADALASLPEPVAAAARARLATLQAPRPALSLGSAALSLDRPRVMGIVNVTPDSFSDGGRHQSVEAAVAHGRALRDAGADILDIGGESTRPGADAVPLDEERRRVLPVVERLAADGAAISVDTRRAAVMAEAVAAGAAMINDVSGLTHDPDALATAAGLDVPVCVMHHRGTPATMQDDPRYDHVRFDVFDWLAERLDALLAAGVRADHVMLDPGIGFGKTVGHNLDLIHGLALYHGLGPALLLGASRKRFIGALSRDEPADRRLGGSLAAVLAGAERAVQLFRVHDVAETAQALAVARAVYGATGGVAAAG
ncbi:dihydropteroate synthase [Rhodothalassium salexigens DSM 2132]|uniref:dihydropteroate synthase n=1 Tax=Rhodothalassium salexigens DSM 2132 TaxID=1188247 RepID=A0A4R2PPS5_RHOSA|nr:dihydropteroate synthase [Rhodothalassium salexigens]MBB4210671.1 dihydropteroate synthase [Rhodothalassium salexigens DSM 2132]MBK1637872.1 dihydropteroate synthase [Rhodothalassium salexigens DSM 2132]TCP37773.1 dihydropteroate synthase [Rhodothalassium salexigens DSM 2132]